MTLEEIETAVRALGRPEVFLVRLQSTRAAALAWDAANPEGAAEYKRLSALLWQAEREWRVKEEAAEAQRWVERTLEQSGIGARAAAGAAAAEDLPGIQAAREWLASGKAWLALLGGTGTGKTTAAAWVMREAAKQLESVEARTASRLARMSVFDEGAREMERLEAASLLVVDDVGAETQTAWGSGLLMELLDARHQGFKKTILTSNLGLEAFKTRIGERMMDRIREDGRIVELPGRSIRRGAR